MEFQQNGKSEHFLEAENPRQRLFQFKPQYQEFVISDLLDLANLSIRDEADLAMNWIKDRPEGLTLQNLALATMTGPAMSSSPKNMTADFQYAINKCESLDSGKQLILHGNPSAIPQDFFSSKSSPSTTFFCRWCNSSAV